MGKLKSTNRFRFICYPFLFVVNLRSFVTCSHEEATQKDMYIAPTQLLAIRGILFIISKLSSKRMLKLLTKDSALKGRG